MSIQKVDPLDEWFATKEGKDMVIRCGDLTAIQVAFNAGVRYGQDTKTEGDRQASGEGKPDREDLLVTQKGDCLSMEDDQSPSKKRV